MIEAIKIMISFLTALALIAGIIFLLFTFPYILLFGLVLMLLGLLIWGLTFCVYQIFFG